MCFHHHTVASAVIKELPLWEAAVPVSWVWQAPWDGNIIAASSSKLHLATSIYSPTLRLQSVIFFDCLAHSWGTDGVCDVWACFMSSVHFVKTDQGLVAAAESLPAPTAAMSLRNDVGILLSCFHNYVVVKQNHCLDGAQRPSVEWIRR